MPTYEYRCANGHEFEQFHRRISDAPSSAECPQCQAPAERKISGGAGLLFKGSGFYLTDYGKNAHRKEAPGKGEGAKPESGGGSGDGGGKSEGGGGGSASGGAGGGSSASGGSSGGSSGGTSGGTSGGSSGAKSE